MSSIEMTPTPVVDSTALFAAVFAVSGQRLLNEATVKNFHKAFVRDLHYLSQLGAIAVRDRSAKQEWVASVNLDWPTQITETEFFRLVKELPKGKRYGFLSK